MKKMWSMLAVLALFFVFTVSARADDKKTLKGTITCAKCDLKLIDKSGKCATVIKVKEKDKDVVYWFDDASGKKYHGKICTEPKKGEVTGTVSKGKKNDMDVMIIT